MPQNEPSVAKIGVVAAKNGPRKGLNEDTLYKFLMVIARCTPVALCEPQQEVRECFHTLAKVSSIFKIP